LTPSPPRSTLFPYTTLFRSSDLPCSFTSNATGVCPRGCTLCVLCHRTARGALQPRQEEMGSSGAPIPTEGNIPLRLGFDAQRERSEEHTSELQSRGHLVCRL